MSARAAWRLASKGFTVFEYAAGKSDWVANGKPREGRLAGTATAGDLVRTDVTTCAPGDKVRDVLAEVEESDVGFALVISEENVLVGVARRSAMRSKLDATVEDVLEPGPSTVRAGEPADGLIQ